MTADRAGPRTRRLLRVAVVVVVLLVGGHTVAWLVVTGRMEAALPGAIAAAGREGWRVESGSVHRGGWPTRAAVRLDGVVATRDLGTTRLRWTAETLEVAITAADPRVLVVSPGGAQAFSMDGALPVTARADALAVRVPLRGGPVLGEVRALSLQWPGGAALRVGTADAQWDGLALAVTAGGIVPVPAMAAPFDGPADLSLRVVGTRPFPVADTPGHSARLWQRAGGRLELRELALHLGSLSAEGSGEGGLDGQLQPEGRATLRVRGAAEMLDAAAGVGLVAPGPASAARAVLSLLTLGARGGPVVVPVALGDRTLTVSRFPLLRVPVLDWGGL